MKARKKDESLGQLAFDWLQATVILPVVQAVREFIKKTDPVLDLNLRNYRIAEGQIGTVAGQKEKFKLNLDAISLLKEIEASNREASDNEKTILVQYTGWGGLSQIFDPRRHDWRSERESLQTLLTDEEYKSARASTPNAHYTAPDVIQFIYQALAKMGFKGGRLIEPSLGIGHFLGFLPGDISSKTNLIGVELDSISGRIAQALYPDVNIQIKGFEEATFPDNFFDVAVGNIPFGDYKVHDPRYRRHAPSIHNYFFMKSIDIVKPGGIVAFVTSRYTMDAKDGKIRRWLSERADLVAAVRLPRTAFKVIAGTDVTTDIIFLRKREDGAVPDDVSWLDTVPFIEDGKDTELVFNEYYDKNPQMALGKHTTESNQYGWDISLAPDDRELKDALAGALAFIPDRIISAAAETKIENTDFRPFVPAPDHVKDGAFVVQDGKLYRKQGAELIAQNFSSSNIKRAEGMVAVRDAARNLLSKQMATSSETAIQSDMAHLNYVYGKYVKQFGFLHKRGNKQVFREDPDFPLLLSLEKYDEELDTAQKAEIFYRRVIFPQKRIEKVETPKEALVVSLNETGRIDFGRMSELTGLTEKELQCALDDLVYLNPDGGWETGDEYLSGNVRAKLNKAEAAAEIDHRYIRNVDALKAVQPPDLPWEEIYARLGASWIPAKYVERFVESLLNLPKCVKIAHAPAIGTWTVSIKGDERWRLHDNIDNTTTWGTSRMSAVNLIEDGLNLRIPTVYDYDSDGKATVNVKETEAAREKLYQIKEQFSAWIWQDDGRKDHLVRKYNDEFNNIRLREYDGSHLTLPGMTSDITLRPNQKNGVWRCLKDRMVLLAHAVGAGKTLTGVAAAMELKRVGLIKKPMFCVPNHLLEQWGAEFLRAYPWANILIAGKDDFAPVNRQTLIAKMTTNNWDAVIVAHSSYGKIPVSKRLVEEHIQRQIDELESAIDAADDNSSRIVKQLEKKKKRLAAKIKDMAREEEKDRGLTFEETGVDFLFVDESDLFKNLYFTTKMNRIAGLSNTESNRAFDMYMKTQWLFHNRGRVVFATGTPISNSMAEMYTVQRYLQPDVLEERGLAHFDSWAADFGEVVTSLEIAPDGSGYRARTRFARFINLPELLSMFRLVADIQTADMLNLPVPVLRGGKPQTVVAQACEQLKEYVRTLVERAEEIRGGHVDPRVDNMLCVTNDGRKAALDMRLVDHLSEESADSKINIAVKNIHEIYRESVIGSGSQLVFCDLSTPKPGIFNVYDDIKVKLMRKGINEKEIAYIHEADTDIRKKALFDKVNAGKVRILMGSTEKMGAGMNVQKKLVSLHHLDAPWRPRDIEQRNGRILRQGNENAEVSIYSYVTEGSFDAYIWVRHAVALLIVWQFISTLLTRPAVPSAVAYRYMRRW